MQSYFIGVIGASILILAWLVNLFRTIKQKAHSIDPIFTSIYIVASALLTYYSILESSNVFALLNGLATLLALLELGAYWYFKR